MEELTYRDFDLRIARYGESQDYRANVRDSQGREASEEFRLPFTEQELEDFLLRLRTPPRRAERNEPQKMKTAKDFGGRLFEAAFHGELLGCLRTSLAEAKALKVGLRLRLRMRKAPELVDLPWEYLYDPSCNRFFALSVRTPVVRDLELTERIPPLSVSPPLRVLVMLSNPRDYTELDAENEWRQLNEALSGLKDLGLVDLLRLDEATLEALQRRLRLQEFHVLHFIGHGGFSEEDQAGVLILETETGQGDPIRGENLGTVLHDHEPLRLVVLNVCEGSRGSHGDPFAGVAQTLIQQGIPAVVAMQSKVTNKTALTLAYEFYRALADGYPVDAGLTEARKTVSFQYCIEWGTPVLYLRAVDGHIFDTEGRIAGSSRADSGTVPRYPDSRTRDLSQALKEAYQYRTELTASEQDYTEVTKTILGLRRRIRDGGQLKEGDFLLDGRFQLLERIGRGGFAQVWKANDRRNHDLVAIKILHGQYSRDETRRERFFRGARRMNQLQHENIVRVIEEQGEDGGYHFFVMEYLGGGDLRKLVHAGLLSKDDGMRILLEVGVALEFAHDKGVIHRDVKPGNILTSLGGQPKLTDFDLVWAADTTGGTRTGPLGTFLYSAPELMVRPQDASAAADIYSLGMTAAFVLHGADLPLDILRHASAFIEELDAPEAWRQALSRAAAWEVENRWKTLGEFCFLLRQGFENESRRNGPSPLENSDLDPARPYSDIISRSVEGSGERVHSTDGSVLVYVPGGEFTLGAADFDQPNWVRQRSEPVHSARLGPFWIGKYLVTNEQYALFLEANPGQQRPEHWDDESFNAPKQPIVGVSWLAAWAYCRWALLDLPTEAQWEAAARGTSERHYPWGDEGPTPELANYMGKKTTPIDAFPGGAGPYGTLDQAGNVWEWCLDKFDRNAYDYRQGQTDPVVKAEVSDESVIRVGRGGSWADGAKFLRTTFRQGYLARLCNRLIGFRVACRCDP